MLDEKLIGSILVELRKKQNYNLYVILNKVVDTNIDNNVIKLYVSDKIILDTLAKEDNIKEIKEILKVLNVPYNLEVDIKENTELIDVGFVEKKLKDEFGNIVEIKKD